MSRAFVREDGAGRWEPGQVAAYQLREAGDPEVLYQGDDLLSVLHWLERQQRGTYELRDRQGRLLARN